MSPSSYKMEILDLANTSGDPVLSWVFSEGGMFATLETEFSMKYQREGERYSVPTLVRAVGPSLDHPDKLTDPFLNVSWRGSSGRIIEAENNDWGTLSNAAAISAIGLNPTDPSESAYQAAVFSTTQRMTVTGTDGYHYDKRARNDVIRLFPPEFREYQTRKAGAQGAWISYDVSTGVNNKAVFAYSLELLQRVSGLSGTVVQTQGDYYSPSELIYYSGFVYSGECSNISLLLEETGLTCKLPPALEEDEPLEVCLPSGLTSGVVRTKIQEILQALRESQSNLGIIEGDAIDDSQISSDNVSLRYAIYQGLIKFNNPYSGDHFCIEPYIYDYTGEYFDQYGVNPPYPAQGVCFHYPEDYTDATGLTQKINDALSGSGYYLWNRAICTDDSASGYFELGGMLKANVSGDYIFLTSLREGLVGKYKFTFYAADRPETGIEQENVLKYMLPQSISLQGAQTYGAWTTLDTRSNVNWKGITPTVVRDTLYDFYTGFPTGSGGAPEENEQDVILDASGAPVKRLVYEARITGRNKCGLTFDKMVEFYEVSSGMTCKSEEDGDDEIDEGGGDGEGATGLNARPVDYFFLKTGWKFSNTGEYNFYRVVLEDFASENQTQNVELSNSFYINGISFYGVSSGAQLLSGQMCLIGADYTGQIMGYASGIITGTLTGWSDATGALCFNKEVVTGVPNGDGWVRFQRRSGQATTAFTGLVDGCVAGTGYYEEDIGGYFYDSGNECVTFYKRVSGVITGSGFLTGGPYAIIRDEVIPTLSGTQVVAGVGYGVLTGLIPNFAFDFSDLAAFGYLSGTWSDTVYPIDSGVIHVSEIVYGFPDQVYSVALSGTRQASAVLTYNSPVSGDRIFINDTVVIYDPFTGNLPPTYFKTLAELTSTINDNSGIFLATGYHDGSSLYLFSTEQGEDGNSILTSSTGSVTRPQFGSTAFTGGENYHYPLTATEPLTGLLELDLFATQSFSVSGSGFLTGSIKQLDFVRYFTGIWGLASGDLDFQILGWVTGAANSRYQNSGFGVLPLYTGRPNVVPLTIGYNNSPLVLTNDLARLRVTGYDTNTGIEMILSGQY